ncbi:MAG: Bacterial CdiA-CT RNAse domain, partial [Frankiales bacterium]|nr:Bacterial CdiA-CT RNAse domain [Frankiales bacterium]
RARLLHAEASDISEAASRRATARLRDLADSALKVEGWQSLNRGIARAAQGFAGVLSANVELAGDAFGSLPGVGDGRSRTAARKALWAAGAATVQPWLAVEQLVDRWQEGDYARTAGEAAGVFVLKGHGGKKEALFGAHNAMPLEVLGALKGFEGPERFVLEHAQASFWKQLQHFAKLPAPTVEELLRDGVDLVQQEALGGHTLLKHVGRDLEFLGRRQLAEAPRSRELKTMSSFASEEEAELAVNRTLGFGSNAAELRAWADSHETKALRLESPAEGMGLVRGPSGTAVPASFAIIEFAKDRRGRVILNSAFLEPHRGAA